MTIQMTDDQLAAALAAKITETREAAGVPNTSPPTAAEIAEALASVLGEGDEVESEIGAFPPGFRGFVPLDEEAGDGPHHAIPLADLDRALDTIATQHGRFHQAEDDHRLAFAQLGKLMNETEVAKPTAYRTRWTVEAGVAQLCARAIALVDYHQGRVAFWETERVTAQEALLAKGIDIRQQMVTGGARFETSLDQGLAARVAECDRKLVEHAQDRDQFRTWVDLLATMDHTGTLTMTRSDFAAFAVPFAAEDDFTLGLAPVAEVEPEEEAGG